MSQSTHQAVPVYDLPAVHPMPRWPRPRKPPTTVQDNDWLGWDGWVNTDDLGLKGRDKSGAV